ncbi:hypothetical protein [Aeropyrum camini]|uniref:Uncharacterized protein n=1 Tax=Aeropyrum camini SY1 = JCM 12091 TaxID=1198449 RepID=U3TCN8_9CREN|nr:hypothetical protein [Aeropyrum camini]BAN89805.1 hypothetical protein ACAM_0336 [Aeropyrum camini SY1 = JCM 12091]
MASRRVLNKYKMLVESLGLKQLDVYRVLREGKPVDVIRVQDPASGKIALVDLGATRESLTLGEFAEKLLAALGESGITVSERLLLRLRSKLQQTG